MVTLSSSRKSLEPNIEESRGPMDKYQTNPSPPMKVGDIIHYGISYERFEAIRARL